MLHELDGGWDRQHRSGVFRPRPLEDIDKARTRCDIWRGVRSPTDGEWLDEILHLAARIEKRRAFWREHPLMTVAKHNVCAQGLQVNRNLPGCVRRIDDCHDHRRQPEG